VLAQMMILWYFNQLYLHGHEGSNIIKTCVCNTTKNIIAANSDPYVVMSNVDCLHLECTLITRLKKSATHVTHEH